MLRTLGILFVCVAAAAAFNLFLAQYIKGYHVQIINMCGIAIIVAVSLNVINGLTGQFSLGHAGFMAIGAYVSAYLTASPQLFDPELQVYIKQSAIITSVWGYVPALVIGGLAAGVAGLVVGIPTLRLKGDYLAIATLGFGEIVRIVIRSIDAVGGANGLSGIPQFQIVLIGAGKEATALGSTFFIFSFACICVLFSRQLQRSTFGRALIAIRENELAAEIMGIRAARLKTMAFVYGAFFAGVAGGLLAHLLHMVQPGTFTFMRSVEAVVMLVLGGLGSLTGAIVGAVTLTVLPEALRGVEAKPNPDIWGMHLLLYGLLVFPLAMLALVPWKDRMAPGIRMGLAAVGSLGGALIVALIVQVWRDDGMQPALPGTRMVVYSMVLILLMIFRPQGIFGQKELSLRLLRRLIPGRGGKGQGGSP